MSGAPAVLRLLLAGLVALASATSASAVALAEDPASLALHLRDCPAGGRYSIGPLPGAIGRGFRAIGVHARGVYGVCDYARSKTGSITLTFTLLVAESAGQARTAFATFAKELRGPSKRKVALPAYGDQELAFVDREGAPAELLVREAAVVWSLSLEASGTRVLTRAQALGALKGFARTQNARVGGG